jgi:Ser/Thr protein kinase RdoA (MazF antagonist)
MEQERSILHIDLSEEQLLSLLKKPFPHCQKLDGCRALSGGALNTTYRVNFGDKSFVIRIYARGRSYCKTENAIYDLIQDTVCTPKLVYSDVSYEPWAYSIFEFVSGRHPFEVPVEEKLPLSFALGRSLASIHRYKFPAAGLFHDGMIIDVPFLEGSSPYYEKAVSVLSTSEDARRHLGPQFADKALSFMERNKAFFQTINNNACLTHSDFKPVNLLYNFDQVHVLDWEFAHAGIGILDFSLILRERDRFPLDRASLVRGYQDFGGTLPEEWYRSALITDFVNIATLLDSPVERPQLCHHLKESMQSTMDNWNAPQ